MRIASQDEVLKGMDEITSAEYNKLKNAVKNIFGDMINTIHGTKTIDGILNDVLLKFIDGTRKWKPDQNTLFNYILGAVRSEVSNELRKIKKTIKENKDPKKEEFEYKKKYKQFNENKMYKLLDKEVEIDKLINDIDGAKNDNKKFISSEKLIIIIKDDVFLKKMIVFILDNPKDSFLNKSLNAQYISKNLGVKITDIYNATKRLKTKLCKL